MYTCLFVIEGLPMSAANHPPVAPKPTKKKGT